MTAEATKSRALITGASTGIGADLARIFAREGYDLVVVARSRERLDALASELRAAGAAVLALPIDLSVAGAAETVHAAVAREGLEIDVLVNDAGFGLHGPIVELDPVRQLEMIQVNIVALTALTRLFAPAMVQRKHGRILNVASTAAFQPCPLMAVYSATKAYVLSFSEALAQELRNTGVTVTCLAPGPTATRFSEAAQMTETRLFRSPMASTDVAAAAYRALIKGKPLVVPGLRNRLLRTLVRFVPITLAARTSLHLLEDA